LQQPQPQAVIPPIPPPSQSQLRSIIPKTEASPSQTEEVNTELQIVDEHGQPIDWQNDPNEPRYCLCNQVSYGDMVGCDNDDVSFSVTQCNVLSLNGSFVSRLYLTVICFS